MHLLRFALSLLIALESISLRAQFSDDFSDGNLNQNPIWVGDSAYFEVVSGVLRLSAPALTDTTFILTSSEVGLEARWSLKISLDFNPSSTNYCLIYLMSNSMDLNGPLNGYFVKIGGITDDVSLYRQDGESIVQLIDGRDKSLNKSHNDISIEVIRGIDYSWILKSDTNASALIFEGTAIDSTHVTSSYFGISCRHTSTRADKFSFDEISVSGKIYTDLTAPVILSHELKGDRTWEIVFDEKLSPKSITLQRILPTFLNGSVSSFNLGNDQKTLSITFDKAFPHGRPLTLSLDSISDTLGNFMKLTTLNALYNDPYRLQFKDIVINEIMFDPTPAQQLPPKEYLELFNRSEFYLDLSAWKLADENDSVALPGRIIAPNEVLLVVSQDDSIDFIDLPSKLLLSDMISLNNNGELLRLLGPMDRVIDSVHFLPSWIQSQEKKEGGWSLELINPEFRCSSGLNWLESTDSRGGSPGDANSVFDSVKTEPEFRLGNFLTITDSLIKVEYYGNYTFEHPFEQHFFFQPILPVSGYQIEENSIDFILDEEINYNTKYTLNVHGLSSCYMNEIEDQSKIFRFPEIPLTDDLVINEILFNPYPGESDFVEIYNNSTKYIDIGRCILSNLNDGKLTNHHFISSTFLGIKPYEYIAICSDTSSVRTVYSSYSGRFHQVSLPSFNDNSGHVLLLNSDELLIDQTYYSEEMHFSLVDDDEGISLERISFNTSGLDPLNWHSAGSLAGYATPAYRNSQSDMGNNPASTFRAEPDIFSPDNDGMNDIVRIDYALLKEGYVGSLWILDKEGQITRNLASNELLGSTGHFIWDGTDEQRKKAPIGYYIVYLELFDVNGKVSHLKTTVVLAHYL